ncbi:MAG: hypothetical protein ACRC2S_18985 [Waterburya sp.]
MNDQKSQNPFNRRNIVLGGAAAIAGLATVFAKSECLIAMLTIKNFFIK